MKPRYYTAWTDYYATGEGSTLMFALSTTPRAAEKLFRDKFGEYFAQGMTVTEELKDIPNGGRMMLPEYIIKAFEAEQIPFLLYHQCHNYNLS